MDQTDTRTAIDELQLFMDRYPASALRDSSQNMIEGLRGKLEVKAFENARLYHKTGNYKSATIAMAHAMEDYPGSPYQEELQFLIIDSHHQIRRAEHQPQEVGAIQRCYSSFSYLWLPFSGKHAHG